MKNPLLQTVSGWTALFRRLKLALPRPRSYRSELDRSDPNWPEADGPAPDRSGPYHPEADRPEPVAAPATSVEELTRYLMLSPKNRYAVRPVDEFILADTDLRQQVLDLVDHLYVRYPVPRFLYRPMLSNEGVRLVFGNASGAGDEARMRREATHRRWFRAVAWGEPFALLVKETLNKREAHWFLQAPSHNDVEKNLRWAKVAALGVPREACDHFLQRFEHHTLSEGRRAELARFYARTWSEILPHEREEIADFVGSKLHDPAFPFAGRTATSIRRLSETWHRQFAAFRPFDGGTSRSLSWRGLFKPWETQDEAKVVRAVELTNGGALADEGAWQGHCVASYAETCWAGRSRIVSVRWFDGDEAREITRLTVEVNVATRTVFQVRGRFNRRASAEEWTVLSLWAKDQELRIPLRS